MRSLVRELIAAGERTKFNWLKIVLLSSLSLHSSVKQ